MGRFVNPNNSAFQVALNSRIYVDKTGLIEYTNSVLDTTNAYICNSRPRRFGKSYAANMLAAYYSKGADSEQMFSGLQISREADFKKHLNKYDVIRVTLEHNCIIKKHKIQRLPQVSRLRHFAVCTKNTENILEKEREKGIMSEKV
ncbi:Predicted AAA-ATPase [Blautia sp. SF-50]|nr:Predicted AAA-ATPase [Blautia sp. SF-50]